MLNIENAKPTAKKILGHINTFENFCMGKTNYSPSEFREINEELSIGAVLMLGTHRYQKGENGKRLLWQGLDECEYDLGFTHEAHIMRDYPGFNAKRSRSLEGDMVADSAVIAGPNGKGNLSIVTMKDGTVGIGPNYKIALRNAALKLHLKSNFNHFSLSALFKRIWGNA
ncbi:MAG: hypothetical protein COA45_01385 [Zetaproteobacteria bacterium]|nr:MAG: hypothetical protein COA45_01385 [Zetaproteobacteria bacterium]